MPLLKGDVLVIILTGLIHIRFEILQQRKVEFLWAVGQTALIGSDLLRGMVCVLNTDAPAELSPNFPKQYPHAVGHRLFLRPDHRRNTLKANLDQDHNPPAT